MKRLITVLAVVIVGFTIGLWFAGPRDPEVPTDGAAGQVPPAPVGATLLPGLGDYRFPVSSQHPEVQRWFDQGLALAYGFNHEAAERSFLKAAELDSACAMCWWGAALVLGPHVNAPMDPGDARCEQVLVRQQRQGLAAHGQGPAAGGGGDAARAGVHHGPVGPLRRTAAG